MTNFMIKILKVNTNFAETIENFGNGLARTSAIIGQHKLAGIVADKAVSISEDVIKKVAQKNAETLTKADPNRKQTTKERLGAIAQNLGGDICETAQIARREFKFREKRTVNAKKARTILTAFAGSIATADVLLCVLTREVGIPLAEAIRLITVNPAKVMGLPNKGDLLPGKDADIVIFDSDINIQGVFVGGKRRI